MNLWLRPFERLAREDGQDIAEYAVLLSVVMAIVVATIQMIGASANNVFSSIASAIH
ncbi:MAG TPA: hypothetical protein VGG46_05915 [Terriglobales bacterium]|jgi:Flp pilus assembly pilin Flp